MILKKIKTVLLLATISCFITNSFSQEGEYITVRDFETWSSVNLEYKPTKKWDFSLGQQIRLNNDSKEMDEFFTDLGIGYSLNKNFTLGLGTRYITENDNVGKIQGYENHLRFNFDFGFKHQVNNLKLKYRFRYQTKNELGVSEEEGDFVNNHFRLKIAGNYNIKKWKLDPSLSAEIFYHSEEGEENEFNKFRITLGTKYKIKGFGDIGIFYRIERELNATYPKTTNIAGLKYTYTIKTK